jgi:hypothetical protein
MKKTFLLIITLIGFHLSFSQYCGNSGASVCTPAGTLVIPGFAPPADNLPVFINGQAQVTVLQFKNYDTLNFGGQLLTVQLLRFDSIGNLPTGLCWASNKASNTYNNQEDGCIRFSGTPCGAPGQYKLKIICTINVGVPIQTNLDAVGIKYWVRLKNNGDTDIALDTSQTTSFVAYGQTANCNGAIALSLGGNQTVCSGTTVTLSPSISNGQTPYSYSWSSTGNSLSCNNCQNPTTTITQNSTYTVTVTDANNNTATAQKTYTVSGSNLQITANGPTTFCQGGSVTLNAGAGYSAYHWSNNSSSQSISVNQSGTYTVTVTTSLSCTFTNSVSVTVNTPTISNYQIIANGPTSFCSGGSVTLNAGSGFTSYQWSDNSTTQTITVNQTGNYNVTVTGTDGCTYTDGQIVNTNASFSGQQVCIVTVDPTSGKNVIVWEKAGGFGIDSFKIYKETTILNQYQLIRKQGFGNFSTYEDAQSNPQQTSNRYVITTVDACGESQYSSAHKTIHLTSNVGINGEVNLIWNAYEGVSYPSFNIYRGSSPTNVAMLTQVSASTTSYTDLLPPAPPLYYQIEVINPNGCVPTAKTESYSSSLSNFVVVQSININEVAGDLDLRIYPIPAQDELNMVINENLVGAQLNIYNASGALVHSTKLATLNQKFDTKSFASGVYVAEVKTATDAKRVRWVKM